jgi:hypothetical protein
MERERGVEEELCILVPPDQLAEIQGGDEKIKMLDSGTGTFFNTTATPSVELGHQKLRDGWQTYKEFEEFRRCEQSTIPLQEFLVQWEASSFSLLLRDFFLLKNSYRCLYSCFEQVLHATATYLYASHWYTRVSAGTAPLVSYRSFRTVLPVELVMDGSEFLRF